MKGKNGSYEVSRWATLLRNNYAVSSSPSSSSPSSREFAADYAYIQQLYPHNVKVTVVYSLCSVFINHGRAEGLAS